MKDKSNDIDGCLILLVGLLVAPLLAALQGWCLATLWNWFIVDLFKVRPLGIWEAFGLALVVRIFTWSKEPKSDDEWYVQLLAPALAYLFCVVVGYMIYHWGMGRP